MSQTFDPYYHWLGIPPEDQPPDHYRLLGLTRFESNPQVIRVAMEQRFAYLRTFQLSKNADLAERLLNEIAAAKMLLLDPKAKTDYDTGLRTSGHAPGPDRRETPCETSPVVEAMADPGDLVFSTAGCSLRHRRRRSKPVQRLWRVTAAACSLVLIAVILVVGARVKLGRDNRASDEVKQRSHLAPAVGFSGLKTTSAPRNKPSLNADTVGGVLLNSFGMKLVRIPAGEFLMGSPAEEQGRRLHEGPQHRVRITRPFYLGVCEVTQEQYENVMGENPSRFHDPMLPVEQVSWDDAVAFCKRLSEKESRAYRLPTEAEWEYACRAGSSTRWCSGNDESVLDDYAWYRANSHRATHPVGQKRPNTWGLCDMHGNVWEWSGDWHDHDYYGDSPMNDPTGPACGSTRVVRGGGWSGDRERCRSALRYNYAPGLRYCYLGFRVALVPAR